MAGYAGRLWCTAVSGSSVRCFVKHQRALWAPFLVLSHRRWPLDERPPRGFDPLECCNPARQVRPTATVPLQRTDHSPGGGKTLHACLAGQVSCLCRCATRYSGNDSWEVSAAQSVSPSTHRHIVEDGSATLGVIHVSRREGGLVKLSHQA